MTKKNRPTPIEPLLSRDELKEMHFAIFYASDDDDVRSSIATTLLKLHYFGENPDQKETSK